MRTPNTEMETWEKTREAEQTETGNTSKTKTVRMPKTGTSNPDSEY